MKEIRDCGCCKFFLVMECNFNENCKIKPVHNCKCIAKFNDKIRQYERESWENEDLGSHEGHKEHYFPTKEELEQINKESEIKDQIPQTHKAPTNYGSHDRKIDASKKEVTNKKGTLLKNSKTN
jgi:hypothetical protein